MSGTPPITDIRDTPMPDLSASLSLGSDANGRNTVVQFVIKCVPHTDRAREQLKAMMDILRMGRGEARMEDHNGGGARLVVYTNTHWEKA